MVGITPVCPGLRYVSGSFSQEIQLVVLALKARVIMSHKPNLDSGSPGRIEHSAFDDLCINPTNKARD